jgi:hypothetical protein
VHSLGDNNGAAVADGTHPPPEVGEQWEAGIKTQWFDDRLTASAAMFDLRKKNVLQADPFNPGFSIAVGEVVSRGIEFDIAGKVTDNLSVIGSYTFDSVKIVNDNNNGDVGKWYNGAAPNVGNLWAKWDAAPGLPEGWELGAGFYAIDRRFGSNDNAWRLPGYIKFDSLLGYRMPIDGHCPLSLKSSSGAVKQNHRTAFCSTNCLRPPKEVRLNGHRKSPGGSRITGGDSVLTIGSLEHDNRGLTSIASVAGSLRKQPTRSTMALPVTRLGRLPKLSGIQKRTCLSV